MIARRELLVLRAAIRTKFGAWTSHPAATGAFSQEEISQKKIQYHDEKYNAQHPSNLKTEVCYIKH